MGEIKYCKRCILHTGIPGVVLDEDGVCNYCKLHDKWEKEYPTGKKGKKILDNILEQVKIDGKDNRYDCIIGVSGGCDSSFLLAYLVDNGVRPLPVHFDNNWNTQTAENNLKNMTRGLGLDFYKIGVDRTEYDDICRSFLKASVPDADIPNDIALTTVLYLAAERFNTKYIMNAHSFRTEGTTPLGWSYMDGGYVENVQKVFGSVPIKSFPNLTWDLFKKFILMGFKRVRPIWYLDYIKVNAMENLKERFSWNWYGGHHMENDYTIFVGNYLHPRKFGLDLRYIEFSALIRSGFMERAEAMEEIEKPPDFNLAILSRVKQRLGLSDEEFEEIMRAPIKSHDDYPTYKPLFRKNKEFFDEAVRDGLIPETFYKKYVEGVS